MTAVADAKLGYGYFEKQDGHGTDPLQRWAAPLREAAHLAHPAPVRARPSLATLPARLDPRFGIAAASLLATLIFGLDLATPPTVSLAFLYCLVVMLAGFQGSAPVLWGWVAFSVGAALATLFALGGGHPAPQAMFNSAAAVAMIVATGFLIARINAALAAPAIESDARIDQSLRIAAIGELPTIIAHEINQPLAAVTTFAEAGSRWLGGDKPDVEEARLAFAHAAQAARYAAEVVDRIRALTARTPAARRAVRIAPVVAGAAELVAREAESAGVNLTLALEGPDAVVTGDPVLLQQVVLNLLNNAIQAVEDRPERRVVLHAFTRDGEAHIRVEDSGPGFSPEASEKAFAPFFSTKPNGTGVGLAVSRSVVESHGGSIAIGRAAGGGACVSIRMPLTRYTIV